MSEKELEPNEDLQFRRLCREARVNEPNPLGERPEWLETLAQLKKTRAYAEERLIIDVTEEIALLMQTKSLTDVQVAARLGISRRRFKNIMAGRRSTSLAEIAHILHVLGAHFEIKARFSEEG